MKIPLIRSILLSAFILHVSCMGISCREKPENRTTPERLPTVTINWKTWKVELAITDRERQKGLSNRAYLPENEGMLFVFPAPEKHTFWMQGCLIPLDIAFIDEDHFIVKIETMTVEPNLVGRKIYSSLVPVRFALEVSAGSLNSAGAKIGDKVVFSGKIPFTAKAYPNP